MREYAFDASFLDIATNTLAIVMIVTMFALLTVKSETAVLLDPRFAKEPELVLRTQPPLQTRPFLDYYLVFDDAIVRWPQELYVERLLADGLRDVVDLPDGKLRVSAVMEPRDPDSFSASFAPNFDVLAEQATPLRSTTVEAVAAEILERYKERGLAPNLVVYGSGMNGFEMLYRELREAQLWMRWFLWTEKFPLKIERRAAHFARFEFEF